MQSIRVNTFALESGREREGRRGTAYRYEKEGSIYSCIQRRTSVTLFYESVDRIALIARRVKLPRGRLLSSDLLECVAWSGLAWLGCAGNGESCVHASGVFSSLRVIVLLRYRIELMGGLTHIKERIMDAPSTDRRRLLSRNNTF